MNAKKVKFSFCLLILMGCFFSSIFAAEFSAKVVSVEGKVERLENDKWLPIHAGDTIKKGTVIQTGFKSNMVLSVHDSTVNVAPLTRMTVEQFAEQEDKDNTSLFVSTGSITSDVRKRKNRKVGFVVRSPVATASVRGTIVSVCNHFKSTEVRNDRGVIDTWASSNAAPIVAGENVDGQVDPNVNADGKKAKPVVLYKNQGVNTNNNGGLDSIHKNTRIRNGSGNNLLITAAAGEAYDSGENNMFDVVLDSGIKNESGANGNIGGKSGVITVGISFPGN